MIFYVNVCLFVCLMVFNATFNTISVISWRLVLLVEETGEPRENHRSRPVASHWQTLSHFVVHLALIEIRTLNISGDRLISDLISTYKSIKWEFPEYDQDVSFIYIGFSVGDPIIKNGRVIFH